jgi:signal transduction histidine kinase
MSPRFARAYASQASTIALTHGVARASLTRYSLDDLIREYQVLREVIFEQLMRRRALSTEEVRVINRSIDIAVREAASAFVGIHEEYRGRASASLIHDLRGPLGAAFNYFGLLSRPTNTTEQACTFAKGAMRNLTRLKQMIEDMLDLSRLHAGEGVPLQLQRLEMREVIQEVLADFSAAHGDRYVLDAPERVEGVWCPEALKRAFYNLLENATKYGESSSPITVAVRASERHVTVSVHNVGPPIPTEELEQLFDAFRRGLEATAGLNQGWGLGLSAVRSIAEAHGGGVVVDSSAEEGTTFMINILVDARQLDPSVPASGRTPSDESPGKVLCDKR